MTENRPGPRPESDKDFNSLVADASDHVLAHYDAQAMAKAPRTRSFKKPLLIVLFVLLAGVAAWNIYYFSRMGRVSAEMEEAYLETAIYLTALTLDAEFEATGAYPASLEEVGMDEEGLSYVRENGSYTLVARGSGVELRYRSAEELAPFKEAFEGRQAGEMRR